jgi:hypothetical protein
MDALQKLQALQAATLKARLVTGDERIGTMANKGRLDIVLVSRPSGRGRTSVETIRSGLTLSEAIAALESMNSRSLAADEA